MDDPTYAEKLAAMYEQGLATRRATLGAEYVDGTIAKRTDFDTDFQMWITNAAWGQVWSRPGMDKKVRSLITVAILAALGRVEELELHLNASQNIGVDPKDIAEMMLHVGVYAGMPAAVRGMAIAKKVLAEREAAAGKPD